jgi:hypothetical protein
MVLEAVAESSAATVGDGYYEAREAVMIERKLRSRTLFIVATAAPPHQQAAHFQGFTTAVRRR